MRSNSVKLVTGESRSYSVPKQGPHLNTAAYSLFLEACLRIDIEFVKGGVGR
jgi:hypothetical protein